MPPSITLARWLAICTHPRAAWVILPRSGRALLFASYAALAFVTTLALLVSTGA